MLSLGVVLGSIAACGAARWARSNTALLLRLESTRQPNTSLRYDSRELEGLPDPVKRYFQLVMKDGQPIVAAAMVEQTGTFNLDPAHDKWKSFTATQRIVTRGPGFVWNARINMAPGIAVYVHDAYIGGEGILNPALLGLFSLAGQTQSHDLAQGELIRYFAEAAWYPTALLPSQGVHWDAIDSKTAKATLVDGTLSVTMLVSFNDASLIESSRVEARGALLGKTVVPTPWEGRWSNYQERDGMLIPLSGEASWIFPEGRTPYWRGTITTSQFEFFES